MARVTRALMSLTLVGVGLSTGCVVADDDHYACYEDHGRHDRWERRPVARRAASSDAQRARQARLEAERELARARSAAEQAEDAALDASLARAAADPLAAGPQRYRAPARHDDDARWAPVSGPEVVVTRVQRAEDVPYAEPWDAQPVVARRVYDLPTCEPVQHDPWGTRQTTYGAPVRDPWTRQTHRRTEVVIGASTWAPRARVIYRRPVTVVCSPAPIPACEPVPARRAVVCAPTYRAPVTTCAPTYRPTYRAPVVCAPTYRPAYRAPVTCAPSYAPRRAGWGVSVGGGWSGSRGGGWSGGSCNTGGRVSVGTSFGVGGVRVGVSSSSRW